MKILLAVNNWVGLEITKWLKSKNEDIVALIIHPIKNGKYTNEIIKEANLESKQIFSAECLNDDIFLKKLQSLKIDFVISAFFGYIFRQSFLSIFSYRVINIHPSYLPHDRGAFPNVWTIINNTPAGVTIHYIDENIDTGDIIAQEKVVKEPIDTGESLYYKLEEKCIELFKKTWPQIKNGKIEIKKQNRNVGSFHYKNEIKEIDYIDLEKKYKAKKLIDIIRARTFKPHKGAYFEVNGKKVFMRIELFYENET